MQGMMDNWKLSWENKWGEKTIYSPLQCESLENNFDKTEGAIKIANGYKQLQRNSPRYVSPSSLVFSKQGTYQDLLPKGV